MCYLRFEPLFIDGASGLSRGLFGPLPFEPHVSRDGLVGEQEPVPLATPGMETNPLSPGGSELWARMMEAPAGAAVASAIAPAASAAARNPCTGRILRA